MAQGAGVESAVIRAVFDTNVLASGFLDLNTAPPGQLISLWRTRRFQLVVSESILEELEDAFSNRYFRRRLSPEMAAENLALLRRAATVANISVPVNGVATHPADDLILAAALSSQAQYLVTGDTQLQNLGTYRGVTILSPRAFLDILSSS